MSSMTDNPPPTQAKDKVVEDEYAAFADAEAQRIFEADPTFGVGWQGCCDSGAKDLTLTEERESEETLGRVRKYQYTGGWYEATLKSYSF